MSATIEKMIALAAALPDGLRENAQALIKDMTTVVQSIDDSERRWRPSNLKIIQALTDTDKIDGDKKSTGMLVLNNAAFEGVLPVQVLRTWEMRQYWDPDLNNTKTLCQSPDAKIGWRWGDCRTCEHSQWVDKTPSPCKKGRSFLVITSDLRQVVEVAFTKTNLEVGNEWYKVVKASGTRPPFQRSYHIGTAKNAKQKQLFNYSIERTENFANDEVTAFLEAVYEHFAAERTAEMELFHKNRAAYAARAAAKEAAEDDGQVVHVRGSAIDEGGETPNYSL